MTWQSRAACRDLPTEWWFPSPTPGTTGEHMYVQGKAVCARCPVRDDCLTDARDADIAFGAHGLRGGLTPGQRAALWGGKRQGGAWVVHSPSTDPGGPVAPQRQASTRPDTRRTA